MRREALSTLIGAATPDQLRLVARVVLRLLGYAHSRITDGPHDGGSDLQVMAADGSVLPLAIQVSVQKQSWESKLRADASRAKKKLGLDVLLFITSVGISQSKWLPLQAELLENPGVKVTVIPPGTIAEMILDHGALPELLRIFDLRSESGSLPTLPADRRSDAAFAYAFFAPEVHAFRDAIREHCLLLALSHANGESSVEQLCDSAARLLGASPGEVERLRPRVDHLRQRGLLQGRNGSVRLSDEQQETFAALRALRRREESALRDELRPLLVTANLQPIDRALDTLIAGIGAVLLRNDRGLEALHGLQHSIRGLRAELRALGLPDGKRGEQLLATLVDRARQSPLGRHLAAGSLYQALTVLDRDGLLRALGARSTSLVLDASVAIPMLCALFHGSIEQRYFLVAAELHRRAIDLGIALELPEVWLEEMASHLLLARDYQALADEEHEDLRLSRNAYVAYYAAKRGTQDVDDFRGFLESFGLTTRTSRDSQSALSQVKSSLRQQLEHYQIRVISTPHTAQALIQIEREWTWALHDLDEPPRLPLLARHDQRVLAWLLSVEPTHAPLLVTWDRLLKRVRPETALGGVLDPLAVSDLLSFIGGDALPAEAVRFAGLALTEAEAERGAAVLDTLVKLEAGNFSDAKLVRMARDFKSQYLQGRHDAPHVAELTAAWRMFRAPPA